MLNYKQYVSLVISMHYTLRIDIKVSIKFNLYSVENILFSGIEGCKKAESDSDSSSLTNGG